MPKEIELVSPVRVSNLRLRKAGMSFKISVPPFWVTNQQMKEGDELETYIDHGGALIIRPVAKAVKA